MKYFKSIIICLTIPLIMFASSTKEIKSLTLHVEKTTLNLDENTTLHVRATYSDNTTKDITNEVEWITTPTASVTIKANTLIATKDINTTLQAKLNDKLSQTINLQLYWEVVGHKLPPQPDKTLNDSTLLGIDVNDNGVRDDVERWIYTTYNTYIPCTLKEIKVTIDNGNVVTAHEEICEDKAVPYHQIVREIGMQGARASQIIIQEPEKARETTHLMDAAQGCNTYFSNRADRYNEPVLVNHLVIGKEFDAIQFNTVQRARAYGKYNFALSGGVYRMPSGMQMRQNCDFNVNKFLGK